MSEPWKACQLQTAHCLDAFRNQHLSETDLTHLGALIEGAKQLRYRITGGQSWPLPAQRNDLPYGFPSALATR